MNCLLITLNFGELRGISPRVLREMSLVSYQILVVVNEVLLPSRRKAQPTTSIESDNPHLAPRFVLANSVFPVLARLSTSFAATTIFFRPRPIRAQGLGGLPMVVWFAQILCAGARVVHG